MHIFDKKDFDRLGNSEEPFFCQNVSVLFPFQTLNNEDLSDEFTNNYYTNERCYLTLSDMKLLDAENCYLQTNEFHDQYKNNNDFFLIHINVEEP